MLPLRDARPPRRTPAITVALLAACSLVFAYELLLELQGGNRLLQFVLGWGLVPADLVAAIEAGDLVSGPTADLFSHMFLHAGWLHLLGNALFLWIFAPNLEDRLGRPGFLAFYLAGGVVAALVHVVIEPSSQLPMVGASGAISAVLGGYLVLFPRARIQSLVFLVFFYELIAVPAVVVLGFWFLLQLVDGFASLGMTVEATGGVAFWAHIGGFVAGVAMALPVRLVGGRVRNDGATSAGAVGSPAGPVSTTDGAHARAERGEAVGSVAVVGPPVVLPGPASGGPPPPPPPGPPPPPSPRP